MANETDRKGYVIAVDKVTDMGPIVDEYAPVAAETIRDHEGEILVGSFDFEEIEGEWGHSDVFVLEFPSVKSAKEWYNDEAYQDIIPVRQDACDYTNLIITSEFSPEDLG